MQVNKQTACEAIEYVINTINTIPITGESNIRRAISSIDNLRIVKEYIESKVVEKEGD